MAGFEFDCASLDENDAIDDRRPEAGDADAD